MFYLFFLTEKFKIFVIEILFSIGKIESSRCYNAREKIIKEPMSPTNFFPSHLIQHRELPKYRTYLNMTNHSMRMNASNKNVSFTFKSISSLEKI